jgi:hypothetical protein
LFANQIYRLLRKEKAISFLNSKNSDNQWLLQNIDTLRRNYENQFVAIHNNQVIASNPDLNALKFSIEEKNLNSKNVFIQFINPKQKADLLRDLK